MSIAPEVVRLGIGGFLVVRAPDLDAALAWGAKLSRATTLPIEVRPFHGEG